MPTTSVTFLATARVFIAQEITLHISNRPRLVKHTPTSPFARHGSGKHKRPLTLLPPSARSHLLNEVQRQRKYLRQKTKYVLFIH